MQTEEEDMRNDAIRAKGDLELFYEQHNAALDESERLFAERPAVHEEEAWAVLEQEDMVPMAGRLPCYSPADDYVTWTADDQTEYEDASTETLSLSGLAERFPEMAGRVREWAIRSGEIRVTDRSKPGQSVAGIVDAVDEMRSRGQVAEEAGR